MCLSKNPQVKSKLVFLLCSSDFTANDIGFELCDFEFHCFVVDSVNGSPFFTANSPDEVYGRHIKASFGLKKDIGC